MKNAKWTWALIAIIATGMASGCGGGKNGAKTPEKDKNGGESPPVVKPKGPGPKEVALAILRAIETGDEKAILANHDLSAGDKTCLLKTMEVMTVMTAFTRAGIKAYGPDPWSAAATKAQMANLGKSPMPSLADAEIKIKCTIDGDEAACTLEGFAAPLYLVLKDGVWLAEVDDVPPGERPEMLKEMSAMVKAMRAVMGKIGQPDTTPDTIFRELAQTMIEALES